MKVTADDIAQLLASTPPRRVPAHVAKAAGGRSSWFLPVFGLIFGGLGLMFTVLFFPWTIRDDWRLDSDAAGTTPGVITDVVRTSLSINERRVMEYGFSYAPEGGPRRQGRCYTTGERWERNDTVTVRYLPGRPDLACVEGARLSEGGLGGAFVVIFPLVGGGLVAWFVVDRRRTRRLLHHGVVTEVDVVSVEQTNTRVNHQYVYNIVVAGPALQGGQPVAVKRVNWPEVHLAMKHAEEKQPVFILYDPRSPKRLLFPEALIEGGG